MTAALAPVLVRYRFAVVALWLGIMVAVALAVPGVEKGQPSPLGGLIPNDSQAVRVGERSAGLFRFPVLADTAVVQRDPDGLSRDAQVRVYERAFNLTRRPDPRATGIAFILPITNSLSIFPASRERSTAAVSYLFVRPDRSPRNRLDLARYFASKYVGQPDDALVGITGAVPAQIEQARLIKASIPKVELLTLLVLAGIVAFAFRAPGAPLMALGVAALANVVAVRAVAVLGRVAGVSVPTELELLVLVLLLAIVVDYSIFFLWEFRRRLRAGEERLSAATRTTAVTAHIVLTAGLIVAAGTLSLLAGQLDFFRAFGPGLAVTALVGVIVSVTLIPALLAIAGKWLFWPSLGAGASTAAVGDGKPETDGLRSRGAWLTRFSIRRPLPTLLVITALLAAAAAGLLHASLGITLIRGLPKDSEPRRAALAASQGFVPGILSPTELLVEAPGIADERVRLTALEFLLEREPGVAAVLGPRENAVPLALGAALSPTGNAARYVVLLDAAPLSGRGIKQFRRIQRRLPSLLRTARLSDARAGFSGATALASETVASTVADLRRIAFVAGLVNFALLAIFLRSLLAPLYLLCTSVVALAASLGLTKFLFQDAFGFGDLTYFVPFIAGVLLLSLGSDYNVYVVGRVWQAAQTRTLREAVAFAAPGAAKAVSVAGLALASSFAVLAIVPIRPFREFAFAMSVGVLLETFLVRAALVPALISIFGRLSRWPSRSPVGSPSLAASALALESASQAAPQLEDEPLRPSLPVPTADGSRARPPSSRRGWPTGFLVVGAIAVAVWAAPRAARRLAKRR